MCWTVFLDLLHPSYLLCVVLTLFLLLCIWFDISNSKIHIFNGTLCTYTFSNVKQYHGDKPNFLHHILNIKPFETNQSIAV